MVIPIRPAAPTAEAVVAGTGRCPGCGALIDVTRQASCEDCGRRTYTRR
ncbi:hypothetical protein [Nocardiopsis composta]|uniref:rRNA maturation endonuclease Nob1 n=1 Tax=Nocardiopsis composta TaxID=157465 RepID=A0A7W8QU82_9ACTN|nr:hypothetical protein [Nocardiopsis composta]MBB5436319.1 rRNA maturation endonuclease Nob1 [Nocardiopsis composta]